MSRISSVSMWCVVFGFIALSGCSGEERSRALASAADASTEVAQDVRAITALADAIVEPASIPETADQALRAILDGLHENRPDAVWDALPASYQKDVNDLVHLFAARMHPEAWKWFLQIARKGAIVLRLPRDDRDEAVTADAPAVTEETGDDTNGDEDDGKIQQLSVKNRLAISKNENARLPHLLSSEKGRTTQTQDTPADQQRREAVARLFDKFADSGPAGLDMLKTTDVGRLLRHDGSRTLLEAWHSATGAAMGSEDMQDIFALVADPSKVRLVLKESTEMVAVVEIIFPNDMPGEIECIRVDQKWIPRLLADAWTETISNLKRGVLESLPSETATENFGPLFQYLGIIDLSFDGDLAQAQSDGDAGDAPGDVNRSVLLDAPMMLLQFLIAGPPPSELDETMTDADGILLDLPKRAEIGSQEDEARKHASTFEQLVGKSLIEEGKQVAVLCYLGAAVQTEHPALAAVVMEELSRRFKVGEIKVVDPSRVISWTKDHAGLTADSDLTALGTELATDYIVQFHIETLGFTEENYPGLRRGRAHGHVVVVEMTADEKGDTRPRVVFKQPFESKYPQNTAVAADAEEADAFRQRYLARLHFELARLFLRNP